MNPSIDSESNGSSMDQSINQQNSESNKENIDLYIALGKIPPLDLQNGGKLRKYLYLSHPVTKKKYYIFSKQGAYILNAYLKLIQRKDGNTIL